MVTFSSDWTEPLSADETVDLLSELSRAHALNGGDVGLRIAACIDARDYGALVSFELDYQLDWNVYQLLECRQALAYWEKADFLELGFDREAVAWSKFLQAEAACLSTNQFFLALRNGGAQMRRRDTRILYAARRKIARVLGPCPDLEKLALRFGPGATTSVKKIESCPQTKMAEGFKCSQDLLSSGRLPSVIREIPHWGAALASKYSIDEEGFLVEHHDVEICCGKLAFVPKSAKTNRAIVVEPVLNTFLQAGIGEFMAKRLLKYGVDIRDQGLNAQMARAGSIDGLIATIDLSSASDTISRELVKFLLPEEWYSLLNAARTSTVVYKKTVIPLQKFSSMGNGFTFPLETLIFWALTYSSCTTEGLAEAAVGSYGDDIFCPSRDALSVIRTLNLCGFTVNSEKSFWTGPFRESCGHDYYKGFDIRPVYVKHRVAVADLFVLHNYFHRQRRDDVSKKLAALVPPSLAIYGPDGYGDGHLLGDWIPRQKKSHLARGYGGVLFDTFTRGKRRQISRYPGDWVSPLYSIYRQGRVGLLFEDGVLAETRPVEFDKCGRPVWTLPGDEGWKRISIYTLDYSVN